MKTLSIIAVNLCFIALTYAQKGTLEVHVEKINSLEGKIYIAIFTKNTFLSQPVLSSDTEIKDNIAKAMFENLEFDTYAIAVYQDVNGNEKLDRGEYGRPKEPWVLSGSQASMMPIWMDAKFDFNTETQSIKFKI